MAKKGKIKGGVLIGQTTFFLSEILSETTSEFMLNMEGVINGDRFYKIVFYQKTLFQV